MARRFRRSARQSESPNQLALSALGMVIRGVVIVVVCLVAFKVIS